MSHETTEPAKKNHVFLIIALIFLSILSFLFYTSFYNPDLTNTITGNVIGESSENLIEIDATLTTPEITNVKGEVEKIDLILQKGTIFIGKGRFDLDRASVIIHNFDGQINFDKNNITKLNGKAKKIFVEGVPITSDSTIKIYSDEELHYNYLKLNNFYLSSLNYETSGVVRLNDGRVVVELDQEEFKINKFQGDLEVRTDKFKIKGTVHKTNLGIVDVKATSEKTKTNNSEN